jgi:hypothetical protein
LLDLRGSFNRCHGGTFFTRQGQQEIAGQIF